eukprot:1390598-Prymnesium_polylepis.1
MALCKAAVRRVGGQEMVGSHLGQAATCEGVSMGAEGQERVARAVVGSEGGGGQACDTMVNGRVGRGAGLSGAE